jgi:hypothetical protein
LRTGVREVMVGREVLGIAGIFNESFERDPMVGLDRSGVDGVFIRGIDRGWFGVLVARGVIVGMVLRTEGEVARIRLCSLVPRVATGAGRVEMVLRSDGVRVASRSDFEVCGRSVRVRLSFIVPMEVIRGVPGVRFARVVAARSIVRVGACLRRSERAVSFRTGS